MAGGKGDRPTERSLLLAREDVLKNLRERYARFGDQLIQYLYESSFQRGGLRRTLAKVIRPVPLDEDRMHEALLRFLTAEGVGAFFDRLGLKESSARTSAGGARESASDKEDNGDITEAYQPRVLAAGPPSVGSVTVPQTVRAGKPGADTGWDGVERRSGFERRTGLERRSGKERRKNIDVVFVNRRFGGNRRSGIERRSGRDRRKNPPPPND
ncbi:hypothetical protein AMJ85_03735 [candidate division BRC1 bacterium SM23_51]|nr:MAG: hypothetical protein AMJ85_03735 [candidate division BRC1 bacterium SM23_51]